jgi:hypothetical protein
MYQLGCHVGYLMTFHQLQMLSQYHITWEDSYVWLIFENGVSKQMWPISRDYCGIWLQNWENLWNLPSGCAITWAKSKVGASKIQINTHLLGNVIKTTDKITKNTIKTHTCKNDNTWSASNCSLTWCKDFVLFETAWYCSMRQLRSFSEASIWKNRCVWKIDSTSKSVGSLFSCMR